MPSQVTAVLGVAAFLWASSPSTAHAQRSNAAKGALIGGAIGAGVGLIIMAVERGRDKDFRLTPKRLEFAETKTGDSMEEVIVVRNTGTRQLRIESAAIQPDGGAFALINAPQMPLSLQPGAEARFAIRFQPGSPKKFSNAVEIRVATRNREPARVTVSVQGRGTR